MKSSTSFALRLPASLKAEAEEVAARDGTSLNQFVTVAVAEKLAVLRSTDIFTRRKGKVDWEAFDRMMARTGGEPPRPGDELPEGFSLPQPGPAPAGFAEGKARYRRKPKAR